MIYNFLMSSVREHVPTVASYSTSGLSGLTPMWSAQTIMAMKHLTCICMSLDIVLLLYNWMTGYLRK